MNSNAGFERFSGQTCLITGGAGAIGSQLARVLVGLGAHVVVLDDLSSGHLENLSPISARIRILRGSIASAEDVKTAFTARLQYVFHLAAQFANQNSIDHPHQDLMTNAVGTQLLLEEARRAPGLRAFVYASSSCVLGSYSGTATEETRLLPETPYGVSKLAGEHYTLVYAHVYGLPATVVRYFNVYGPGEYPGLYRNVIPNFVHRALHGQPLPITGTGKETREFVYVADAVAGTLLAALNPAAKGEVFHLGSGQELMIREVAEKIAELSGNGSRIEYFPRRSWDCVAHRRTSSEKAVRVLGYAAKTPFDEGLRATVRWLAELERSMGEHRADEVTRAG